MDVTEKDILEVFSALGDDILKASQRHRHSVLYWIVKNNSIKIFKHFIEDEDRTSKINLSAVDLLANSLFLI